MIEEGTAPRQIARAVVLMGDLWRLLGQPLSALRSARHATSRRCGASGWGLHVTCTDGQGKAVCPLCTRPVPTRAEAVSGRAIRGIEEHAA